VPPDIAESQLGDAVDSAIETAFPGFLNGLQHRAILTPRTIEENYSITDGALGHGELMLDQILFMRPLPELSKHDTPVAGLFLGGSGSHPGPGITGAAGTLAARTLLRG
jgi:phytoene dehydrogenase-like protein